MAIAALFVAGCGSPKAPASNPEPEVTNDPEPATSERGRFPIDTLREELPQALANNTFGLLEPLLTKNVSVRTDCGPVWAWDARDPTKWLTDNIEAFNYKKPITAECDGGCCRVESGAPTMCEACIAAVTVCLEGGKISSIAIENTDGVICDEEPEP